MNRAMKTAKAWMVLGALSIFLFLTHSLRAQTGTVLHSFKSKEGASSMMGLVFDSSGNLYGVAGGEGGSGAGSVFELSPSGSNWAEKTLHSFSGGSDGGTPRGTLILDSSGNLYGTAKLGGSNGVGVAYELTKSASGTWLEKVLHNFGGAKDGQYPVGISASILRVISTARLKVVVHMATARKMSVVRRTNWPAQRNPAQAGPKP
jgi:uncharacterized repeat protein (TIGR03803 family)